MTLSFFLGIPLDAKIREELSRAPSFEKALFTTGGEYLKEVVIEDRPFLGKEIVTFLSSNHMKSRYSKNAKTDGSDGLGITLEELISHEAHVLSLFHRLFPHAPISKQSLILSLFSHETTSFDVGA